VSHAVHNLSRCPRRAPVSAPHCPVCVNAVLPRLTCWGYNPRLPCRASVARQHLLWIELAYRPPAAGGVACGKANRLVAHSPPAGMSIVSMDFRWSVWRIRPTGRAARSRDEPASASQISWIINLRTFVAQQFWLSDAVAVYVYSSSAARVGRLPDEPRQGCGGR
jgi:hypothetical protein